MELNSDKLAAVSGVLGVAISLVTLLVDLFTRNNTESKYILFGLGVLLVLVWITWVTKRLLSAKPIIEIGRVHLGQTRFENPMPIGTLDSESPGVRSEDFSVRFKRIFTKPPKVFISIGMFSLSTECYKEDKNPTKINTRYPKMKVFVRHEKTTKNNFTFCVRTWGNARIFVADIDYIAIGE